MRKMWLVVILVLVLAIPSVDGVVFTPMQWAQDDYEFSLRAGLGYYKDGHNTRREDVTDIAVYVQTPVVEWDKAWISFGGVFPLSHMKRSRPEFSLNTSVGQWLDVSDLLDFEIGGFWAMSPYGAYGGLLGFLRVTF